MQLDDALRARFEAVNGRHRMTEIDDRYVDQHFVALTPAAFGSAASELAAQMLAGELPLLPYIRSTGELMVSPHVLDLVTEAGSIVDLPAWFGSQFTDPGTATEEWHAYLTGGYHVCLREPSPETIQRKARLITTIQSLVGGPDDDNAETWQPSRDVSDPEELQRLHAAVDQLDALEMPFAPYDRLRFGRPVSRDLFINRVRQRYPRATKPSSLAGNR